MVKLNDTMQCSVMDGRSVSIFRKQLVDRKTDSAHVLFINASEQLHATGYLAQLSSSHALY